MQEQTTEQTHFTLEELAVKYGPIEMQRPMSREAFVALAERYPNLAVERDADGTITFMAALKKGSGRRESKLHGLLFLWNLQHSHGEVFGPNGTYDLPDGATKMPDVSWISPERLPDLSDDDEEAFIQVLPDFVAEIRSQSDRLNKLQAKMTDSWMANGVRLAWLIDPYEEKAYVYRQGKAVEVVSGFESRILSGEDVLPGFELELREMMRKG
ncbi:MAG: Uma2 family endonuclease [Saprospiraceae bacterium]|nr:Uma2 family endonuclease [Saprospiraceae bacterium]